jgi:N-acetylglucosamine kinase-like BadF-type ATPase
VLGTGASTSSKVQRVGEACARDALSAAIHEACGQARISPRQIARTCAGITGSGRNEIAALMRDLLSSIVGGEIETVGDVEIAFDDAFSKTPGVIVIAGTGAIVYGRNSRGESARAGGWGFPISDEGSGFWIGAEAVRATLHAHDSGENPPLLRELVQASGARDFEDFIVRMNAQPSPDFATLFPVVLASADRRDPIASNVLLRAGRELAGMAETVLRRLKEEDLPVATHGGVFSASAIVRKSFTDELHARVPRAKLLDRVIDPSRGALERARKAFASANA